MVGDRLKEIRNYFDLSQLEFANKLMLNKSSISLFENNKRDLSQRTFISICETFNIDELWLKTGQGTMFPEGSENLILLNSIVEALNVDDINILNAIRKLISLTPDEINAINNVMDQFSSVKKEGK
ncbi:helix-turn-helix transcriptional regulator [uncultured Clostridium sp.]|uniref:helix-turn-helix domain-containing protein n=1 Tax=uncultured Clostridium sp. TaxID=59620 RepID=UPI002601DEED|nr:helix-turn-helix transcriptional regulator [uncultured Clostridium sp.]